MLFAVFGPSVKAEDGTFFYVRTGQTYAQVKQNLFNDKILTATPWFDRVAKYLDYDVAVKPGKYPLVDGMSVFNIVRMLRAGRQTPVKLVLVKLRTKEELASRLGKNFEPDSLAIISFLNNADSLSNYGLDTNTVMTMIIPNTYLYRWNSSPSQLFQRLDNERGKFWTDERKQAARSLGLNTEQVYTLASIVEEETNLQDDKGKIASVYLNRVRLGMKLAADPTVKFAMRNFGLKRIYNKHLSFPSPYNTYINTGLPPGPICTPSIKTLDATLNAPETDYIFFVARADFSGHSDFAATYDQHLKYAKAYREALDREMRKRDSLKSTN